MELNAGQFVIVPFEKMNEILLKLDQLYDAVLNKKNEVVNHGLDDFIAETEAKVILNRGTTWFWKKRDSGDLTGKFNGHWYYRKSDIMSFIEGGITKRKIKKAN